jgi:hypothetical protein
MGGLPIAESSPTAMALKSDEQALLHSRLVPVTGIRFRQSVTVIV